MKGKKIDEELYNTMYELRVMEGLTAKQIANKLGKSLSTIEGYLVRHKLYRIDINNDTRKIESFLEEGFAPKEISKMMNKSIFSIYYHIKKIERGE